MQTLKTAAVVVLLMTVMYGAYVSLTTPPESLPPEVAELVLDEGGFDIESGLPESLGSLGISSGSPAATASMNDSADGIYRNEMNQIGGQSYNVSDGVSAQMSDSGSVSDLTIYQPDDAALPQRNTPASFASASLNNTPPNDGMNYPSTSMSFDMPNPSQMDASLDAGGAPTDLGATDIAAFDPSLDSTPAVTAVASGSGTSTSLSDPVSQTGAVAGSEFPGGPSKPNLGLTNAIRTADQQYASDQRKEALTTLSLFYNTPDLSVSERSELLGRLDPLAAEVIYSKRHLLEQAYRVGHHETLMQIAVRYEVPWQLLANINGIEDPITVLPGTELKVVRGPFRAEVNLSSKELTLFLGDLYAGRFPIAIGNDPSPKPGTFTVQDKQSERTYYGASGGTIPSGNPNNPYGNLWLDLGSQLCIHGSPYATKPSEQGCISVAADYADDLYGILTQGSSVTIRR
ncbi:L,D-transpeptidase family protein [Novipirellula artificiosorum]|uniref:L,D-transpeptidase family protein n=1 Tax=Novipirellula artificiosorum TaxID=2528016 RepID=UPI001E4AFBBE|nr:L,D-transpeptidase family protein [Novipirellula artificiosorum]